MKHMLWTQLQLGGENLAVIGLARADAGRGFTPATQDVLRQLAPALSLAESFLRLRFAAAASEGSGDDPPLTRKEREVLELFEQGASYGDVARILAISINTVRDHVRNIYEKLHVASKVEAVMKLRQTRSPR
jgi:DNA-binding CsgD family transcriptional regulator